MLYNFFNIFAKLNIIIGFIIIIMLLSKLISERVLENINELVHGKSFEEFKSQEKSKEYFKFKRIFDLIFSIISLIILLPSIFIISVFIKLESQGPVFEKKKKLGKDGNSLFLYEFRTYDYNKTEKDNKNSYTKFGLFLYRTSLYKLPMFINVIKGELSIVGVSTYNKKELKSLPKHIKNKILKNNPGIISLWTISKDKQNGNYEYKPYFDLYYNSNASLLLDLLILIRSIVISFAITTEY